MTSTFGRIGKKLLGAAMAGTLGVAGVAALVPGAAGAAQAVTTQRFAGTNRYGTAAAVAAAAFPAGNNNIVIASGENFPDGLAAATLAGAVGGPILLTAKDTLPQETSNALGSLDNAAAGPGTVYVVGGTAAISDSVRNQLKSLGYTGGQLVEISGTDRYDTAAKVAAAAALKAANIVFNGLRTAIVATGEAFPDALAGGSPAYVHRMPVLLTTSAALSPAANQALTDRSIQQVIVMGGTAAVSQAVRDAITGKGISLVELKGVDRFDTAAQLAALLAKASGLGGFGFDHCIAEPDGAEPAGCAAPQAGAGVTVVASDPTNDVGVDQVVLAYGLNFPDALAAAPLAGVRLAPIVLTASIPDKTKGFLNDNKATIDRVAATGGTAVIPDADLTQAGTEATSGTPTATITANDGSRVITIVYSENVPTGSGGAGVADLANFKLNNAAFPGGTAISYLGVTRTTTITLPAAAPALVPGDTVAITAGTVCTMETIPRCVPSTSFVVVNDATPATATLLAFAGSQRAWVVFSEPVTTASGVAAADFGLGDLVTNSDETFAGGTFTQYTPTVFLATTGGGNVFEAGDGVTLNTTWTDLGGNTPTTTFSTSAVNDTSPPILSTAQGFTVHVGQAAATTPAGGGGTITVTAKAGGDADGAAGNGLTGGWKITRNDNNGALNVLVDTGSKTITVNSDLDNSAGQQTSALNVANALAGNATFASRFTVTNTAGQFQDLVGPPFGETTNLTGGLTTFSILTNFSEGIDSATSDLTNFNLDTTGDGVAEIFGAPGLPGGAAITETNAHVGSVIMTFITDNALHKLQAGTSKLQVAAASGITDLSGLNTFSAAGGSVVVN